MARRAGHIQLNDVLEQLDSSGDEWIAEGSDDDLEMESSYSYEASKG